ncbi:MAG: hypothetical protein ABJF01_10055 [bacterium]
MPSQTGVISLTAPSANSIVGRIFILGGSLNPPFTAKATISAQFIVGGVVVGSAAVTNSSGFIVFQMQVPNAVHAGQAFTIRVTAHDQIGTFLTVDGTAQLNVMLENALPTVTLDPVQTPKVEAIIPYSLTLTGTAFEISPVHGHIAPYAIQQVTCQVASGPVVAATALVADWSKWQAVVSLPVGDSLVHIRASDPFGAVTEIQKLITVDQYVTPTPADPNAKPTYSNLPSTASITSWTRLEPQATNADIGTSTSARIFDPLWMMTRQWQVGEFQAEDAGTPIQARVRATSAVLSRARAGELTANTTAPAYDPTAVPLEALVERRRMRAVDASEAQMLPAAVEAALQFLRLLDADLAAKVYRPAFLHAFTLQPLSAQAAAITDDDTLRFVQANVGRAPDARLLASAFRTTGGAPIAFDAALDIATADVAAVQTVAVTWLAWYDALFAEPLTPADDAWIPSRLEYAVSVGTRLSDQEPVTLSASEFDGGRLDWSSFDVNATFSVDSTGDRPFAAVNEATVPSPVTFRGAPAARFWEMEDATLAYGLLPVGPTDLAQLMMIEYASSYGNDWFVVPLTVPIGSLTRVDSLVITDTFGVKSLVRPIGDPALPAPFFSMWQQAYVRRAGEQPVAPVVNRFFLPPTLGKAIDGGMIEDVLFMRDEMANIAWAIEKSVEGPMEQPVMLAESATSAGSVAAPPADVGTPPRYLLSSTVPSNWIPLLPVQLDGGAGVLVLRLKRGAMLQPDGSNIVRTGRSQALNVAASLLLYDEEVPRDGVHITRRRRAARWIDGSTWLWTAFRNETGTGEGSAGLQFDQVQDGAVG